MELDMELVYGSEEYEDIQDYFEHRKLNYPSGSQTMLDRLSNEYVPEVWGIEDGEKKNKISDRRKTLDRILELLEEVPSNCEDTPVGEAEGEG